MGPEPDLLRQAHPSNAGVAVFAPIAELRFVHLCMAGDTRGPGGGRLGVACVVARFALGLRMSSGETQPRMIAANVGDLAPIGFVVTRGAFCIPEPALVWVLMTRRALGLEPEKGWIAAPVSTIVAVFASDGGMGAVKRPSRLPVIETGGASPRPTDELCVSSEMLDVASAAFLASILASVEPCLFPHLRA